MSLFTRPPSASYAWDCMHAQESTVCPLHAIVLLAPSFFARACCALSLALSLSLSLLDRWARPADSWNSALILDRC